jgi:hypothetical protein
MDQVTSQYPLTFNGPLEAGVRAVALLAAAFPRSFDVQRITAMDYLLMHTQELGGPENLHPAAPIQIPATEVRRKVVQSALHLMMTRDLVCREVTNEGIHYRAGESAAPFLNAFQSPYLVLLRDHASWLMSHLGSYTDPEFSGLMRKFFEEWVEEFQEVKVSLGDDQ